MTSLEAFGDAVKSALDDYVATLSLHSADPPSVVSKAGGLQEAIKSFVDASVDMTGWGNPFITPDVESDPAADLGRDRGNDVVGVDAHYVVRVTDASSLGRFVAQLSVGDSEHLDEQVDPPAAQINKIFTRDGWDPYKYQEEGLEVLEAKWEIFPSTPPSKS